MALDYLSIIQCMGIIIMMFCFLAWLFDQRWARWLFILFAHFFALIMLNLAREIAIKDALSTDIIKILQLGYTSLLWITILICFVFMINLLWLSFESFVLIKNKRRQHPDSQSDYMEPRGTN